MAVGDAHVFLGFLKPVLTQLSFQIHLVWERVNHRFINMVEWLYSERKRLFIQDQPIDNVMVDLIVHTDLLI